MDRLLCTCGFRGSHITALGRASRSRSRCVGMPVLYTKYPFIARVKHISGRREGSLDHVDRARYAHYIRACLDCLAANRLPRGMTGAHVARTARVCLPQQPAECGAILKTPYSSVHEIVEPLETQYSSQFATLGSILAGAGARCGT